MNRNDHYYKYNKIRGGTSIYQVRGFSIDNCKSNRRGHVMNKISFDTYLYVGWNETLNYVSISFLLCLPPYILKAQK